ncbi:hypothetical protein CUMW_121370 [Citrus unshiu]|nr:hypothetical protein CUMW_121370 [Citrus unshiu]
MAQTKVLTYTILLALLLCMSHQNAAETIMTLENASQERMINLTLVSAGNFAAPNVREPNANCWAIVTNVIVCVDDHVERLRLYL